MGAPRWKRGPSLTDVLTSFLFASVSEHHTALCHQYTCHKPGSPLTPLPPHSVLKPFGLDFVLEPPGPPFPTLPCAQEASLSLPPCRATMGSLCPSTEARYFLCSTPQLSSLPPISFLARGGNGSPLFLAVGYNIIFYSFS